MGKILEAVPIVKRRSRTLAMPPSIRQDASYQSVRGAIYNRMLEDGYAFTS
jgi:hypothetical protein